MRISATTLESFRLWSDPNQTWMPESDLIDNIKGVVIPTPKMMIGQAGHRALEKPEKYLKEGRYRVPVKSAEGWVTYWFDEQNMIPAFEKFDRNGVFEVKQTREYSGHTVVTKVDQILGTRIIENKFKLASSFDFDRYADSCQWRFELDILGADALTYNIFLCEEGDRDGEIVLRDVQSFNLYPYAGLRRDCSLIVNRFSNYVEMRGLTEYLQERTYA